MTNLNFRNSRPSWSWSIVIGLFIAAVVLASVGWWQATAVGDQVSVPMFYDAHYLFPRPWTQEQEAPEIPDPTLLSVLYGPNRVSQSFVSGADRLSLIAVWLAGPENSFVQVSLSDESGPVYGTELQIDETAGRYYFLSVPTINEAQGRQFLLTLRAP